MKLNNQLQISTDQQNFSIIDIASIWAGINICLPSFMLGGLLVPSLSFKHTILVTLTGNIILTILIIFMALPGLQMGYASVYLNRSLFGYPAGVIIPSVAVIITMIGWSAILLEMTGQAALEISSFYNINLPDYIIIFVVGFIVIISSCAGADKIKLINKFNIPALIILIGWIAYILFKQNTFNDLITYQPTGRLSINDALDLVVGGTIAGAFVSSDLCRYARSKKALAGGVALGTIPATFLLAIIGIFSSLAAGTWNPVTVIINLGLGIPALLLVIISTWTTLQASLYSASLAFTHLFPAVNRKKSTALMGIGLILLAALKIMSHIESWLLLLNNIFAPMITIFLIKYFFQKPDPFKKSINWQVLFSISGSIIINLFCSLPLPTFLSLMVWTGLLYTSTDSIKRKFL